jgi:hypothetical protein
MCPVIKVWDIHMPITTLGVLAIMILACLAGGVVALRFWMESIGLWLLTTGFAIAVIWSILGMRWAQLHDSSITPKLYLTMATMAAAGVIYFGDRASRTERIGKRG